MAQQTVVELLHQQSNELIKQYLNGKIDKRELLTMHHNLLYSHKQMEKERMIDFAEKYSYNLTSTSAEGFYNETYGKE